VLMGNLGIASWSSMRRVLSSLRDKTRDDFEAGLLDRLLRPDKLSAPRASR